jgi:DNA polymerase III delta subunit
MPEQQRVLLHGDPYRSACALAERHEAIAQDAPEVERRPLFMDEIDWAAWAIELRSEGLFSPARHFVVRSAGKQASAKPLLEALTGDLAANTFVTLVFADLRATSPLLKGFKGLGKAIALPTPKGTSLRSAVRSILQDAGCPAPPALIEAMLERSGNDLLHHDHEARKLATYLGDARSERVPESLLYTAGERTMWTLLDSIGARDVVAAFGELGRLHEDPGRLLAMSIRHLGRVTMVRTMLDDDVPQSDIASITGSRGWMLNKLLRQARAWRSLEIRAALRSSIALDISVKDGERRAADALAELILATPPQPS